MSNKSNLIRIAGEHLADVRRHPEDTYVLMRNFRRLLASADATAADLEMTESDVCEVEQRGHMTAARNLVRRALEEERKGVYDLECLTRLTRHIEHAQALLEDLGLTRGRYDGMLAKAKAQSAERQAENYRASRSGKLEEPPLDLKLDPPSLDFDLDAPRPPPNKAITKFSLDANTSDWQT